MHKSDKIHAHTIMMHSVQALYCNWDCHWDCLRILGLSVYREDNRDIKLDAILVKENIDENNYILYHYTTDEVLFATLYISDNTLKDIKLEFDDENLVKTRSLASWYQCANDEYQNYKDFYENNHPIACDIGDLFFGACTVGGVLGSAIYCAF